MLLLLIAFSLGPLLIFNLWVYQVSRSYWVDMARRDVRHVAKMEVARTLQAVLDRKHRLETVAAGDRKLLESIESFQKAPREAGARALAELGDHLQFIIGQAPAMEALTLIAPTGDVIVRSRPGLEGLGRDARCLSGPLDQVRVLGLEATGSIPTLIVAAPLLDTGGRRLAVLCGRFLFDTHESFVAAHDEISDDSALFLLDEERRVICGSGPPTFRRIIPRAWRGDRKVCSRERPVR